MAYTLTINGTTRTVDVEGEMPLLWVLRDELDLKGSKHGCGAGLCGACTVHIGGQPVRSCITPVEIVDGPVTTVEALSGSPQGKALQAAWVALDVPQCGYCQAGQLMAAAALLKAKPKPTDADIDEAMSGNLCRCATYRRIRRAIKTAAGETVTDEA
jgi:isoquinoline 1-oxidoreductase subunit alpha